MPVSHATHSLRSAHAKNLTFHTGKYEMQSENTQKNAIRCHAKWVRIDRIGLLFFQCKTLNTKRVKFNSFECDANGLCSTKQCNAILQQRRSRATTCGACFRYPPALAIIKRNIASATKDFNSIAMINIRSTGLFFGDIIRIAGWEALRAIVARDVFTLGLINQLELVLVGKIGDLP